jgi:P27 family predicted phage terminase small subunit
VGRRGPPPKPTAQKKLEGTYRKDRAAGGNELAPPPAVPVCPKWLKGAAKIEWDRVVPQLAEAGVLTGLDGGQLERYCDAYGNWLAARADVTKRGVTLKTQFGPQNNPSVKRAFDERKEADRLAQELGLSPSARSRVKVPEKAPAADPTEAFLFGKPQLVKPA